jgi:hypothetical protein
MRLWLAELIAMSIPAVVGFGVGSTSCQSLPLLLSR